MFCDRRWLIAPLALVAACTPVDHGLGEAVRYNSLAQTVNPDPVYGPDATQPGYHGEKAQKATERYRRDQVKDVETIETTSGIGGGSSGSGGGSGPR